MIIGVTGTIGAGKGTVAEYLTRKGFKHVSVSAFLGQEATRREEFQTRASFRKIGNEFRVKSPSALIEAVLGAMNPAKENIVIEALHTVPEVEYIKHLGGKVFSIDASFMTRFERIKARDDGKDPVFKEFLGEQDLQMSSPNENENNILTAISAADFHLKNDGTPEELYAAIDAILAQIS